MTSDSLSTYGEDLDAQLDDGSGLTPEQQRLVWSDYTYFVSAGAKLDVGAKQKLSKINQDLASLFTKSNRTLATCRPPT